MTSSMEFYSLILSSRHMECINTHLSYNMTGEICFKGFFSYLLVYAYILYSEYRLGYTCYVTLLSPRKFVWNFTVFEIWHGVISKFIPLLLYFTWEKCVSGCIYDTASTEDSKLCVCYLLKISSVHRTLWSHAMISTEDSNNSFV